MTEIKKIIWLLLLMVCYYHLQLLSLANHFFEAIKTIDCKLLSVSVDLKKHCEKYSMPVNVTAYTLYLILEGFQYFLEELDEYGKVIYERFGGSLRKELV